ncbi:hypothetical protein K7G98_09660 [Saccharothrix sp. MB29]|nr:hypothetical protein [Saccharothrix sp. MB29]
MTAAREERGDVSAGDRRWGDRGEAIGRGVTWLARWSTRVALAALGFVLLWWLIGKLWVVVMPVLLACSSPPCWGRRRGGCAAAACRRPWPRRSCCWSAWACWAAWSR